MSTTSILFLPIQLGSSESSVSKASYVGSLTTPLWPMNLGAYLVSSYCLLGWRQLLAAFLKVWHLGNTHDVPLLEAVPLTL